MTLPRRRAGRNRADGPRLGHVRRRRRPRAPRPRPETAGRATTTSPSPPSPARAEGRHALRPRPRRPPVGVLRRRRRPARMRAPTPRRGGRRAPRWRIRRAQPASRSHLDDRDVADRPPHRAGAGRARAAPRAGHPASTTTHCAEHASSIVARGSPEHHLGGQAVAELGVDRVGADHRLGELRPRVGVLVGEAGAADHPDRLGARARPGHAARRSATTVKRLGPRHGHELVDTVAPAGGGPAHERLDQAVLGVDRLVAETALVAQPALVQRVAVDPEQTGDPVRRGLDRGPATERAQSCTSTPPGRGPTAGR